MNLDGRAMIFFCNENELTWLQEWNSFEQKHETFVINLKFSNENFSTFLEPDVSINVIMIENQVFPFPKKPEL